MLAGLAGIFIGLIISSVNEDSFGWSLLRTSALGVVFALAARYLIYQSLRAWLETKMEAFEKKLSEKNADAAKGQVAKAGASH